MLNKDCVRELAYLVKIDELRPIAGYDRVEHARVGGWWVIVKKDQFKVGDPAIYIEVDAKVPEKEPFMFLEKRNFKVKTLKMCKVISQGLLMSLEDFGWKLRGENSNIIHTDKGLDDYLKLKSDERENIIKLCDKFVKDIESITDKYQYKEFHRQDNIMSAIFYICMKYEHIEILTEKWNIDIN